MTEPSSASPNVNGKSLKNLDWPTLILVLATGSVNLLNTNSNSNARSYQLDRALTQIQELHSALDTTDSRQRQAIDHFTKLIEGQNRIMGSQSKILENDTIMLKEVHDLLQKLEEIRRIERMPGAHP